MLEIRWMKATGLEIKDPELFVAESDKTSPEKTEENFEK